MHKDLEIKEFFIEGQEQKKSHVLLHITEPTTPEEKREGYFFAIAEIENGSTEQIRHVQKMIDDIESGFYETEDAEANSFESTLEYINKRSHKVLQYEDSTVHCFVCAVKENQVSFAYHGAPQAYLFFNDKKGYQQMDLIEEENKSKDQLFSSILEGEIHTGDVLYIGTPNISKLLSQDRLKNIVSNNSIMQAAQHIQRSLTGFKPELSFGGLLFQLKKESNTQSPQSSRNNTSKETNYRPTGGTNEQKEQNITQKVIVSLGKIITKGAKSIFRFFAKIFISIKNGVVALAILITNRGGQRKTIIRSIKRGFRDKKTSFKQLPWLSKTLLVLAILFALTFVGSISYIKYQEAKQAEVQAYKNKIQAIKNKKNKAKSELIYEKRDKAISLLEEAKTMLSELKGVKTEKDLQSKQELKKQIETQLNKARKIKMVSGEKIATLDKEINNDRLTKLGNNLIAFGSETTTMEIVDKSSQELQNKDYSTYPKITQAAPAKESESVVFLTKDKQAVTLDSSLNLSKEEFFPKEEANIADISTYASNLYVLDTNNNQIYKHSPIQTGYAKSNPWLSEEIDIDLSNAVSMAIDGNIFVLKENGKIIKLFKGKKEQFQVSEVKPNLTTTTQMWANSNSDYIYLLEPQRSRIVILNKEGELQHQLSSDQWKEPESMVINEEENVGYVLDENQLIKFELKL